MKDLREIAATQLRGYYRNFVVKIKKCGAS
jgi:hypothetical protein